MRTFFFLGLWAITVAGCGGNVAVGTGGAGGHGTGATTTTGSSTSSNGSTSSSGTGACDPTTCNAGLDCCGPACVNFNNDIHNCGACGTVCAGPNPFCDNGACGTAPCGVCPAGELCCVVPGPITMSAMCTAPVNGTCPVGCPQCKCASPGTPIATPQGERPIADLAVGDLVYSVDHDAVVAVPVLRVNRTPVRDHHVVRVTLASGAVLEISALHPTADGRTFGDLHAGGTLDGIAVTSAEIVPYGHPFTFDILPASDTGTYHAGGARIGSTLFPAGRERAR